MTITAKIIADNISETGARITTMQLRYPRMVHSELMTHRAFSRNASSSRAVPITRMIQDVIDDPAMPVAWGSNKPGMQAGDEVAHPDIAAEVWLDARDRAVSAAQAMDLLGAHKQIANRLLEPFAYISVVITGTDWANFFDLRCHPDADPTMRALAEAMRNAMEASRPQFIPPGYWHAPYWGEDGVAEDRSVGITCSSARCARVSYLRHDGQRPTIEEDRALAVRLRDSWHLSPFEHQARPANGRHANLNGWISQRTLMEVAR